MTRSEFLGKYFLRFAATLSLLGLIVYTIYHVFGSSAGSLLTVPVRSITDIQKMSGEAYLFRDEDVFYTDSPGVIDELVAGGSKVSRNVEIVRIWHDYEMNDIDGVQKALNRLNRTIGVMEESIAAPDDTLADAEAYRDRASACYAAIREGIEAGEWSGLGALEDEMLAMLNRHAALIGQDGGTQQMLSELKAQRDSLLVGQSTTLYNTVSSGYFYGGSYVDGLEAVFSSKTLEGLTPEGLEELKSRNPVSMPAAYAVGKMAYTSRWYLAISFSAGAEEVLDVGEYYEFLFPENAGKELTLQCVELTAGETGEILAVFSSDEVPSDFRYLRVQAVEITVDTCTGYYVPETALHTVDGAEGVYIFKDSTVYFRKVLVLYRGDGYIIAQEQGDLGKEYLNLYDIMVTYGKDLYEGRVYR